MELYGNEELLYEVELKLEDDELKVLFEEEEIDSAKTFGLGPIIKPNTRLDKIIDRPAKRTRGFLFDFLYIYILKIIIKITFLKRNYKQSIKLIA